jgi:hypothetical protein
MTTHLPPTVAAYIRAINNHDAAAFIALFADGTIVNDEFHLRCEFPG